MFSTFLDRDDYNLPAIIAALKAEREEARLIKASMDCVRYAARIGLIIDALEIAMENKEGCAE
ncbi:MAG: hypothetical protein IJ173_12680 [Kiritimatiellae bacterium]|nr:hypothetical protein [Kiritimatiellia bacterium]MBQ8126708.1 hypothetical protein [Kiritimatiellia bacterium]